MNHLINLFSILGLAFAATAAPQLSQPPEPGQPAPDFTAKDISGKTIRLSDYKGKIVVLEPLLDPYGSFSSWSRKQYESGLMPATQRQCASNGVVWLIIDDSGVRRQRPADLKKAFNSEKMTITDWIIDAFPSPQSVATLYRTKGRPEIEQMYIINQNGILAYTGDVASERTRGDDPSTTTNYLLRAVSESLAGKKVSIPHHEPELDLALSVGPEIGKPAPDFTAKDISGKNIKLSDYKGKIVVMESYENGCPWSTFEYRSDAMQAVQRLLASKGVVWLIVNPGLDHQSPATAKREWTRLRMTIADWIIDDPAQSLCRQYGIRVTPQTFVIDKDGVLAYSGAIQDKKMNLTFRGRCYVRDAVNELLAGKKVSLPHVKPLGCMIPYPEIADTWREAQAMAAVK